MAVSAVREFKEGPSSADVLIVFRVGGPLKKGLRRVLLGAEIGRASCRERV